MRSENGSTVSARVSPNKKFNVFLLRSVFKHAEQDTIIYIKKSSPVLVPVLVGIKLQHVTVFSGGSRPNVDLMIVLHWKEGRKCFI